MAPNLPTPPLTPKPQQATVKLDLTCYIHCLKQKTNEILPAAIEKIKFSSSRKQPHVPLDYNL